MRILTTVIRREDMFGYSEEEDHYNFYYKGNNTIILIHAERIVKHYDFNIWNGMTC